MIRFVVLFICFNLFLVSPAWAFPLPKASGAHVLISKQFTTDYNFEGIVALSNCSGSLIRFKDSRDTDKAMIITNGHCMEGGFIRPGNFVYGKQTSRRFTLLTPDASSAGTVNATQIIYGTMTRTDMTLYRLRETYSDILKNFNIRPLLLSDVHPNEGERMEVVSGYWRRGYRCSIEKFITHLKEENWIWDDSIRYSRPGCEVIGGTSGSPILSESRTVIGLNNTGNEDNQSCTQNNPCEIDESGSVSFQKGFSYGQQAYWLYSCLNSSNEVDLAVDGCKLLH